ncbi:MAG: 7-cyano-7-deazaguanine synthase [Bdellovibrionaceae bacterium]|nr:7-cyano-7-deazaguanine synthase [Pseudobdellovibrionaceae bacterium]MDW8190041.1 7-cyano-7-deazaguanine synthase [Pseudobdellovibrionaceae bacterium]
MSGTSLDRSGVVLLSGGLDSVANLYLALKKDYRIHLALTFDYGQRAVRREVAVARYHCNQLKIPHRVIKLPWLKEVTRTSLVNRRSQIPKGSLVKIENRSHSLKTAQQVWVPNRNGLFLNIAATFADAFRWSFILVGFNREEAATFSDNSERFCLTSNRFFYDSTWNHVKVKSLTLSLMKEEIVKKINGLFPLETLWPCYFSGSKWCGQCESCLRFARAVKRCEYLWEELSAKNAVFIRKFRNL